MRERASGGHPAKRGGNGLGEAVEDSRGGGTGIHLPFKRV